MRTIATATSILIFLMFFALKPSRIFNTWMGDQSKLVLLKEVVKTIREEGLLQRVKETGQVLLCGLENIQVITCQI